MTQPIERLTEQTPTTSPRTAEVDQRSGTHRPVPHAQKSDAGKSQSPALLYRPDSGAPGDAVPARVLHSVVPSTRFQLTDPLHRGRTSTAPTTPRVTGQGKTRHPSVVREGHALAHQHRPGPIDPAATLLILDSQQRPISLHNPPPRDVVILRGRGHPGVVVRTATKNVADCPSMVPSETQALGKFAIRDHRASWDGANRGIDSLGVNTHRTIIPALWFSAMPMRVVSPAREPSPGLPQSDGCDRSHRRWNDPGSGRRDRRRQRRRPLTPGRVIARVVDASVDAAACRRESSLQPSHDLRLGGRGPS
jgi:hypothetical protein